MSADGSPPLDPSGPPDLPPAASAVPPSPLTETRAPATGTTDPALTELTPEEEPNTTGTLFLTMIILTVIGAVWVVVYRLLLER
jgi:hypothetical protein